MKVFSLLTLAVLTVSASAQTVLTNAVYNGHTYSLLSQSNWTDAEAKAVLLGGHLATINDLAENDWIYGAFSNYGGQGRNLWTGLNDAAQEGVYVWVSGETSSFRSWAERQPDNHQWVGRDEDYVHFYRPTYLSGGWNDAPDVSDFSEVGDPLPVGSLYGVVEVDAVPEPATFAALGVGALALLRRRRAA